MTRHQTFKGRWSSMGDESEAVYEKVLPVGKSVRFGWDRTEADMRYMEDKIKNLPDYYSNQGYLVEVMGMKGDTLRGMKVRKWESMKAWNKDQPMLYFIWNTMPPRAEKGMWLIVDHAGMQQIVAKARNAGIKSFPSDGIEYYEIKWGWLLERLQLWGEEVG